jgi:hypothetical protein
VRYLAIYAGAAEARILTASMTAVEMRPSRLTDARGIVDVTGKHFVRVDITEEFSVPGDQDVAVLSALTQSPTLAFTAEGLPVVGSHSNRADAAKWVRFMEVDASLGDGTRWWLATCEERGSYDASRLQC